MPLTVVCEILPGSHCLYYFTADVQVDNCGGYSTRKLKFSRKADVLGWVRDLTAFPLINHRLKTGDDAEPAYIEIARKDLEPLQSELGNSGEGRARNYSVTHLMRIER